MPLGSRGLNNGRVNDLSERPGPYAASRQEFHHHPYFISLLTELQFQLFGCRTEVNDRQN